jgi:hypothetical protein
MTLLQESPLPLPYMTEAQQTQQDPLDASSFNASTSMEIGRDAEIEVGRDAPAIDMAYRRESYVFAGEPSVPLEEAEKSKMDDLLSFDQSMEKERAVRLDEPSFAEKDQQNLDFLEPVGDFGDNAGPEDFPLELSFELNPVNESQ